MIRGVLRYPLLRVFSEDTSLLSFDALSVLTSLPPLVVLLLTCVQRLRIAVSVYMSHAILPSDRERRKALESLAIPKVSAAGFTSS